MLDIIADIPVLGNLVNALAVVIGSLLGIVGQRLVSSRLQVALMQAVGLGTAFIGLAGALRQMLVATGTNGAVTLDTRGTTLLVISLIIGTLVGQAIDIEGRLDTFATWLHTHVSRTSSRKNGSTKNAGAGRFNEGFVTGSLIICTGALAVIGGLDDGMGNHQTLFVKAVLDFVIVFTLAASLGIGVAFSAVPLFVYQGIFCVIGMLAGNVMTSEMTEALSLVGNALVFAVGLNLLLRDTLGEHKIKVGNMLPALVIAVTYAAVFGI